MREEKNASSKNTISVKQTRRDSGRILKDYYSYGMKTSSYMFRISHGWKMDGGKEGGWVKDKDA